MKIALACQEKDHNVFILASSKSSTQKKQASDWISETTNFKTDHNYFDFNEYSPIAPNYLFKVIIGRLLAFFEESHDWLLF